MPLAIIPLGSPQPRDILLCLHVVSPTSSVAGYIHAKDKKPMKASELKGEVSTFLANHLRNTVGEQEVWKMGSKEAIVIIHEAQGVLKPQEILPKEGRLIALSPTSVQPSSLLSMLPREAMNGCATYQPTDLKPMFSSPPPLPSALVGSSIPAANLNTIMSSILALRGQVTDLQADNTLLKGQVADL
ncbi:hypothetical protein C0991_002326 [Blastosporella zonata]|nr:hypothetical protein C0991_002326 [Blastosporella zonata]